MRIEIIVVVLYFIGMLLIGFLYRAKAKGSAEGYFVANREIGPFVGALAMASAYMSANAFMGIAGMGYKFGLPFVFTVIGMCGIGFIVAEAMVATPLARRAKDFSLSDYLSERYGSRLISWLVPIITIILMTTYIIPQLKASALILNKLVSIPYVWGVLITGAIYVLYVSMGGMWAVTITDVAQALIMAGAMIILGCYTFFVLNSPGEMISLAMANNPKLGGLGLPKLSYVGAGFLWFFGVVGLPHLIMRVFTAKGERVARRTLLYAVIYFDLFYLLGVSLVTIVGSALFPKLADPDNCTLYVATLMSPFFQGLICAGLLAAVMSTTDALLITTSAAVSHDIYQKLINPGTSQERVVLIGNIAVWAVGIAGVIGALKPPALINIIVAATIGTAASSFAMPLILGIYWKGATKLAGEVGILGGFIVSFGLYLGKVVPPMSEAIFGISASGLVMIVISLIQRKHDGLVWQRQDR